MKTKAILFSILACSFIAGCTEQKTTEELHVATSAEYPPFEYIKAGNITGYDVELAQMIGKILGKQVKFDNMQFSSILPALSTHQADMAISTITITEERTKHVVFSQPYYHEQMAVVFQQHQSIVKPSDLCGKKVATQLGTTMALWLKSEVQCADLVLMNTNPIAIEALKVGQVDAVVLDGTQAVIFSQKYDGLSYHAIGEAASGYGIAFPKGSPLVAQVNMALSQLEKSGELEKLKQKWVIHAQDN